MPSYDFAVDLEALVKAAQGTAETVELFHDKDVSDLVPTKDALGNDTIWGAVDEFQERESWKAFGSTDEVRPLPAADFAEVVRLLAVDSILFDPALPTAIEIPVDDVVAMLRGVVPGTEGESRILGDLHAQADVALRDRVAEQISDSLPSKLLGRIWAFSRLAPAGSVPVVALAAGIDDADLQRVAAALRASDLPKELEALILDEKQTRLADENWHDLRIQPSP